MQATTRTEPATIAIDVLRQDQEQFLSGTFNQPPALVRVRRNTNVQWQLNNAGARDNFIVSFPHGSPFGEVTTVSDRTGPLPAVNKGSFHYQVFVLEGISGKVYAVQHCPQVEVDD